MQIKTRPILFGIGAIATIIFILNLFTSADTQYKEEVFEARIKKARFLEFSPNSPYVLANTRYLPQKFYEPDPKFRVFATLEKYIEPIPIELSVSHEGKPKSYKVLGLLKFKLKINGQTQDLSLQALVGKTASGNWEEGSLFVPFSDLTNGDKTYGGGRFLDIAYKGQNPIELDFNYAYNPWCAYVPTYICPLPPEDNKLPVAILAGEQYEANP